MCRDLTYFAISEPADYIVTQRIPKGGSCTPEVEFTFITRVSSEATADFRSSKADHRFCSGFFPAAHLHIIYIHQQTMKN